MNSTAKLALSIAGVIVVLIVVCLGVVGYKISKNPDVMKVVSAMEAGAELLDKAGTAPGTAELRALGCAKAMVIDSRDLEKLESVLAKGGPDAGETPRAARPGTRLITCEWSPFAETGPSCDDVARVYGEADPDAPERFVVQVNSRKGPCKGEYSRSGQPHETAEAEAAPAVEPDDALEARVERAEEALAKGDIDVAKSELESVLAERPTHVEALLMRGEIRERARRLRDAEADYRTAAEAAPENPRAHEALGLVLAVQKRYRECAEAFGSVIELEPTRPGNYRRRADCHELHGNVAAAAIDRRKACDLEPTHESCPPGSADAGEPNQEATP